MSLVIHERPGPPLLSAMNHDRRLVGTIEPRIDHRKHFQIVYVKSCIFVRIFKSTIDAWLGIERKNSDGVTILHIYSLEAWQPNDGSKGKPQKSLLHLGKETLSRNVLLTCPPTSCCVARDNHSLTEPSRSTQCRRKINEMYADASR